MAQHVKKLKIDDSKVVGDLIPLICDKFGISDFEEYSLICDYSDQSATMNGNTLRKQSERDLTKIRRKIHTEDDTNWLVHSKTLRQQEVPDNCALILKRKYFFSDQNVSDRDPIQLQLLYVQIKEAVLNGDHPITMDEAIRLAALQCQIERGSFYNNDKKNFSIDLKSHLPVEYAKKRGIDKKIKEAYKCFDLMKENIAKVEYIKLCRSLPTYGISFFLVKEKEKNRNRLVPILFGISKESVYRVDVKTKEIVEKWPLNQISQWVPGSNTFALSFGEYRNDYIIATSEGYRISQMLSGYIDIIMRKTKKQEPIQNDVEEESTIFEDCIEPQSGNIIVLGGNKQPETFTMVDLQKNSRAMYPDHGHIVYESEVIQTGGLLVNGSEMKSRNNTSGEKPTVIDLKANNKPIKALVQIINSGLKTIEEIGEEFDDSLTDYEDVYPDDEEMKIDYQHSNFTEGEMKEASNTNQKAISEPAMIDWIKRELDKTIFHCNNHLSGISHGTIDLISKSRNCLAKEYNSSGPKDEISIPSPSDVNDISLSLLSIKMNVPSLFNQVKRMNNCDKKFSSILEEKSLEITTEGGAHLKVAAKDLAHALRNLMEAADVRKKLPEDDKINDDFEDDLNNMFTNDRIKNSPQYYIELIKAAMQVGNASKGLFENISQKKPDTMEINKERICSDDYDVLLKSIRSISNEKNAIDSLSVDIIREIDLIKQRLSTQSLINDIKIYENNHLNQTIEEILDFNKTFEMDVNCIVSQIESCYFFINGPEFQKCINNSIMNLQNSLNCFKSMEERFDQHANSLNRNRLSYLQDFDDSILERLRTKITVLNDHLNDFKSEVYRFSQQGNINQAVLTLVNSDLDQGSSGSSLMKQAKFFLVSMNEIIELSNGNEKSENFVKELVTCRDALKSTMEHIETNKIDYESEEVKSELYRLMKEVSDVFNEKNNSLLCVCMSDQLELVSRLTSLSATQFILTSQEIGQKQIYDGVTNSKMIFSNDEWTNQLSELETKTLPSVANEIILVKRNLNDYGQLHSLYKSAKILVTSLERLINLSDDVAPMITDKSSSHNFQTCLVSMKSSCDDLNRHLNLTKKIFTRNVDKKDTKKPKKENSKKNLPIILQNKIQEHSNRLCSIMKSSKSPNKGINLSVISKNLGESIELFTRKYFDSFGFNPPNECMTQSEIEEKKLPELAFILMREFGEFSQSTGRTRLRESSVAVINEIFDNLGNIIGYMKELSNQYSQISADTPSTNNLLKIMAYSENVPEEMLTSDEFNVSLKKNIHEINSKLQTIGTQSISNVQSILTRSIEHPVTYENSFINETEKTLKEIELLSTNIRAINGYLPGNDVIQRLRVLSSELSQLMEQAPSNSINSAPQIKNELETSIKKLNQISKNLTDLSSSQCSAEMKQSNNDNELIELIKNSSNLAGVVNKLKSTFLGCGERELRLYQQFPTILNELINSLNSSLRFVDEKKRQDAALSLYNSSLMLSQWSTKFDQTLNAVVPTPRKSVTEIANVTVGIVDGVMNNSTVVSSPSQNSSRKSSKGNDYIQDLIKQILSNLRTNVNLSSNDNKFAYLNMPVSNDNIFECNQKIELTGRKLIHSIREISKGTSSKENYETVTRIAKEAVEILNASRQAAYIKSVTHESSNPGRIAKLSEDQQRKIRMYQEKIDSISKAIQSPKRMTKEEILMINDEINESVDGICDISIGCLLDLKQMDRRVINRSLESVREINSDLKEIIESISQSNMDHVPVDVINTYAKTIYDQRASIFDLLNCLDDFTSQIHSKISEKSFTEQDAILNCNTRLYGDLEELLNLCPRILQDTSIEFCVYEGKADKVDDSLKNLQMEISNNYPGLEATAKFQDILQHQIKELDNYLMKMLMNPNVANDKSFDDEIVILGKLCQNICIYSRKIGTDVRHNRPEFMTHDLNDFAQIINRFIQTTKESASRMKKADHRETFIQTSKTVIEAISSHIHDIQESLENRQLSQNLSSNYEQINLATCEFCNFLDQIGSSEGGKNSCVTIIKAACERLEDYIPRLELRPENGVNSDEMIHNIHSKLINQSIIVQNLIENSNSENVNSEGSQNQSSKLAYEFSKLCDIVQTICYHQVLSMLNVNNSHQQVAKSRKLRHATINLGLECINMLQMPTSNYQKVLIGQENLVEIIKGFYPVLQVFLVNLNKLKQLIEAIDQVSKNVNEGTFIPIAEVILKAYSGCSDDSNKAIIYQSILSNKSSVSTLKQTAMLASKEIIENLTTLPTNQDELFIWARMCHLKMANLAESIFHVVNKINRVNESQQDKYSQLNLLSKTKDLALEIVRLLEVSKSGLNDNGNNSDMQNQMVEMISANGKLLEEIQKLNSPLKSNRKSIAVDNNQQSIEFINEIIQFLSDKTKDLEKLKTNRVAKLNEISYTQKNSETIHYFEQIHFKIDELDKKLSQKDRSIAQLNDMIFALRGLINAIFINIQLFQSQFFKENYHMVEDVLGNLEEILVGLYKMFSSIREIIIQSPKSPQLPDISAPVKIASRSYRFSSRTVIDSLKKIVISFEDTEE